MTKKKYGEEKPVGKAWERRCIFGGYCEATTLDAQDPFTGETFAQVVCKHCGKPY